MLKVKNIQKRFGELEVIKGVDFEIAPGEVVAIIGPSGSGKSTLVKTFNFLVKPDMGTMTFDGATVDMHHAHTREIDGIRKQTGMVFQNFGLFPHLSVLENVILSLKKVHQFSEADAKARGLELLARVGLLEKANAAPRTLSGGQQQRVGMSRAIASRPKLLILDEPTSALDPELVGEVLAVIKEIKNDHMSMVVVTHEMRFAKEVADRIIFMDHGQIVASGSPEEMFSENAPPRLKQFTSSFVMNYS